MEDYSNLKAIAQRLRRHIINMVAAANSGHPGGSLSAVEIMTALYFKLMNIDVAQPRWPERDIFVLSKGHATPVYYAALAERGFFSRRSSPVSGLSTAASRAIPTGKRPLGGYDYRLFGSGLSAANGMALGAKLDGQHQRWIYVLLGDGELQEGQVWEAA